MSLANHSIASTVQLTILSFVVLHMLSACGRQAELPETFLPEPEWLDDKDAPVLHTSEDVSRLWGSKKRCCISKRALIRNNREFYRSCYVAVAEHLDDDELVVKCMWLMDNALERNDRYTLQRSLLDRYPDHDDNVERCANCMPADTIARLTNELARQEIYRGNPEEAIRLVENVLDKRLNEISLWVQVELYTSLAKWYAETTMTMAAIERLQSARDRLKRLRDRNQALDRRFDTFEKTLQSVL